MEFMMEAIQKSMVLNQHQQSHFRTVFLSPSLCLKKKKKQIILPLENVI